ncbi:hypothetical protein LINGRAHAP2_LOCUS31848 [Linum grandiflorum]
MGFFPRGQPQNLRRCARGDESRSP